MSFNERHIVLHLTDIHAGEVVDLPENRYNLSICKARLGAVFAEALALATDFGRSRNLEELHILLTGDLIHNETMRGSAKMSAECNFLEAMSHISEWLSCNIVLFAEQFEALKAVKVYGATGNHGRIGKPGEEDPNASLDRQVYKLLELQTTVLASKSEALQRRGVDFTFNFPLGNVVTGSFGGVSFAAEHWHNVKSVLSIPFYGLARLRDRRYKQFKGDMQCYFGGHFHKAFYEEDGPIETFMGSSLVGVNGHARSSALTGDAKQWLYLAGDDGITVRYPIRVHHIQEAA